VVFSEQDTLFIAWKWLDIITDTLFMQLVLSNIKFSFPLQHLIFYVFSLCSLQIKDNRRADKITSGPQSHILEGVSWEEAKKLQVRILLSLHMDCPSVTLLGTRNSVTLLRRIFGPKREDRLWRKLHNDELHSLYSSPNIIRVIKSRRMRWAEHVADMGMVVVFIGFWLGGLKLRDHWEDLGIGGRITLRWTLGRWGLMG
jgi:hypothetical protein